ncbi:mechanosensitive ion channel domain-containing protein [Paracoccus sp. p3-h83]|uniref:mechanosensitive ion channel domain-containing protein n=1 Tax=Paracoccus sp. p3-h83 TaxID=3342805 RepID=UPI0035B8ED46
MMQRLWGAILALSIGFAAPLMAQDTAAPPEGTISISEDPAAIDARIRARIDEILDQIGGYDQVGVAVESGIVTLTGEALDGAAVERLDRLTTRVEGVVEVQNKVRETTDLSERLNPVWERFQDRMWSLLARLPLLAVAALVGGLVWFGLNWVARRHQPWARLAPNPFIAEILRAVLRLVAVIAGVVVALDILGATALLGTFLGAAGIVGIALGFAVRDSVENFIASIMLSLRQPFRPNDLVEIAGDTGRVIRLTSRATSLLSPDGNHIRIPNATVFKARIVNYTRNAERRFQFDLTIDAGCDLAAAREVGLDKLKRLDFVLEQPAPGAVLHDIADGAAVLRFTGWVDQHSANFQMARGEAIRLVRHALLKAGFKLADGGLSVALSGAVLTGAAAAGAGDDLPVDDVDDRPAAVDAPEEDALHRMVDAERAATQETDLLSARAEQE